MNNFLTESNNGSSLMEVFFRKGVLKIFAKFTRKQMCQSSFFNKVAGQAFNFIKKETVAQMFSCKLCKISKNIFFYKTSLVAASVITLAIKALAHEYSQTSPNI